MVLGSWLLRGTSAAAAGLLPKPGFGLSGSVWSRAYTRDFWAKGTSLNYTQPGNRWSHKHIFRNGKPFNLWLKNSGPKRESYMAVRRQKSFDAMMKYEEGRIKMMKRLIRGDKKIAEF